MVGKGQSIVNIVVSLASNKDEGWIDLPALSGVDVSLSPTGMSLFRAKPPMLHHNSLASVR